MTLVLEPDSGLQIIGEDTRMPDFIGSPTMVEYAAENNVDLAIIVQTADWGYETDVDGVPTSPLTIRDNLAARVWPAIDACNDAHVNFWLEVEWPMYWGANRPLPRWPNSPPTTITTTPAEYDALMGPMFETLENSGSGITPYYKGYMFEGVWDIGFKWLHDRNASIGNDLKIWYNFNGDWLYNGNPNTLYGVTPQTWDFRLQLADEITVTQYLIYNSGVFGPWITGAIRTAVDLMNYQPEGYTKPPIGVQSSLGIWGLNEWTMWGYTYHDYRFGFCDTEWPINVQMGRAWYYLNYVLEQTGQSSFENVNIWTSGFTVPPPVSVTWQEMIALFGRFCQTYPQIDLKNIAYPI